MSQSLGIFVGDYLPTPTSPVPSWLWQLKSGATMDNLSTQRWLSQTHRQSTSCIHWLTLIQILPLWAEPAPDNRSLKGSLPVSLEVPCTAFLTLRLTSQKCDDHRLPCPQAAVPTGMERTKGGLIGCYAHVMKKATDPEGPKRRGISTQATHLWFSYCWQKADIRADGTGYFVT